MFDKDWITNELKADPASSFQTAFTHRSYLNESSKQEESNERLEFLGDSILSFIISSYLYKIRPGDAEGDLTNLRSYLVKTPSLAKAAKKLDLGTKLRLSKGEELSGGRENIQLLANTYEALIGAIYIEKGLEEAKQFVHETLLPLFKDEVISGPPKDAKSELQEISQNLTKQSPTYKILKTQGPDHARQFTIGVFLQGKQLGEGQGLSKQVAEEEAARKALEQLNSEKILAVDEPT